jgi:hypothetical protein
MSALLERVDQAISVTEVSIPILGIVGAPVMAAVVVILYSVGLDAFSRWVSESYDTKNIEQ